MDVLERALAENILLEQLIKIKAEFKAKSNGRMYIRVPGYRGQTLSRESYTRLLELVHRDIISVEVGGERAFLHFALDKLLGRPMKAEASDG